MMLFIQVSVQNLYVLTMIVLLWIVVLVSVLLAFSYFRNRRRAKEYHWQALLTEVITEAIIEQNVQKREEVVENLAYAGFRNMFLNELVATESKFSGASFASIKELFVLYELEPYVLAKLDSRKSFVVAKGLRELRAMKVTSALPLIELKLSHPSPEIYLQAQYAVVYIKGFEGLYFLTDLAHRLSDWQQMKLLSCIKQIPTEGTADIAAWLQSENTTVCVFALRMIRKFQLFNFLDSILNLWQHPSIPVRLQAVKSLDMLEGTQTSLQLKAHFSDQPEVVQIEIIKLLHKLRNKTDKDFFLAQLLGDAPNMVKVLAAEGMVNWGFKDELLQLAREKNDTKDLSLIIKHALREEIC